MDAFTTCEFSVNWTALRSEKAIVSKLVTSMYVTPLTDFG